MTSLTSYQRGGALDEGGLYVRRDIEDDLLRACRGGEFVHVLSGRQTGKTSLIMHCRRQLRGEDIGSIYIDLSLLGSPTENTTATDWFYGVAYEILTDRDNSPAALAELHAWWNHKDRAALTPERRLIDFLADELRRAPRRVVLCFDEIDATRNFPFGERLFFALRSPTFA